MRRGTKDLAGRGAPPTPPATPPQLNDGLAVADPQTPLAGPARLAGLADSYVLPSLMCGKPGP